MATPPRKRSPAGTKPRRGKAPAGFGERLRTLMIEALGGETRKKTGRASSGAAAPKRASAKERRPMMDLESPDFAAALRAMFKDHQQPVVGGLHVIGLAEVRRRIGDRWPQMEERVRTIAREAIDRRLTDEDMCAGFRGEAFVVLFARLTTEMAQLKCALIADEIARRVFGEDATPDKMDVVTATFGSDGDVALQRVDLRAVREGMGRRVAGAVQVAPGGAIEETPPSGVPPPKSGGEAEQPGRFTVEEPGWWSKVPVTRADADLESERTAMAAELLRHLPKREAKLFDFGPLDFVYRPMWLVKQGVTSAHVCVPYRVTSEGTPKIGGAALLSSPGNPVNAEYDAGCLHKVEQEIKLLESVGATALIVVPVHLVSVTETRARTGYLDALMNLDPGRRARMVFEIISIPAGTPTAKLQQGVGTLKPFARVINLRLRLDTTDFSVFGGLGLHAVGCDITNLRLSEADMIRTFETFVERAKRIGLRTYIHGLRSRSLVSAALCAGFDYVDGDPVRVPLEVPQQENQPFDLASLYRPLVERLLGPEP